MATFSPNYGQSPAPSFGSGSFGQTPASSAGGFYPQSSSMAPGMSPNGSFRQTPDQSFGNSPGSFYGQPMSGQSPQFMQSPQDSQFAQPSMMNPQFGQSPMGSQSPQFMQSPQQFSQPMMNMYPQSGSFSQSPMLNGQSPMVNSSVNQSPSSPKDSTSSSLNQSSNQSPDGGQYISEVKMINPQTGAVQTLSKSPAIGGFSPLRTGSVTDMGLPAISNGMSSTSSSPVSSPRSLPAISSPMASLPALAPLPALSSSTSASSSMALPRVNAILPTSDKSTIVTTAPTYRDSVLNSSVSQKLMKLNYAPLARIVVPDHTGVKMVKCRNVNGDVVFVILDSDQAYLEILKSDQSVIHRDKAKVIPLHVQMSALECKGLEICAVALTCGDEVCVVSHDKDLKTVTSTFSLIHATDEALGSVNSRTDPTDTGHNIGVLGGYAAHPVVRLTEILADPAAVLEASSKVSARLRAMSLDSLEKSLTVIAEHSVQATDMAVSILKKAKDVKDHRDKVEGYNKTYRAGPEAYRDSKGQSLPIERHADFMKAGDQTRQSLVKANDSVDGTAALSAQAAQLVVELNDIRARLRALYLEATSRREGSGIDG